MDVTRNPFGRSLPDDSTAFLIVRIANLHHRKLNAELAPLGLTWAQYVLLAGAYWLASVGREATQVAVVDLVKFDKSTVSSVLKTLVARGLVARCEHPVDTRAKLLSVTEKGAALLERAAGVVEEVDEAIFGDSDAINGELLSILSRYGKMF